MAPMGGKSHTGADKPYARIAGAAQCFVKMPMHLRALPYRRSSGAAYIFILMSRRHALDTRCGAGFSRESFLDAAPA